MAKSVSALLVVVTLFGATVASAVEVDFATVSLGGNNYRYDYQIRNDGSLGGATSIQLIDLLFDPALFEESTLTNVSAPSLAADWSQSFLASAPGVSAAFDLYTAGPGIAVGGQLGGSAVEFHWLGSGAPGGQAFEIYDPGSFALLGQGMTTPVPEPVTWAMMAIGATMVKLRRGTERSCVRKNVMTSPPSVRKIAVALLAVWPLFCAAQPNLSVTGYQLVAQKRINATVFEYTYRATIQNAGTVAKSASAVLSSLPSMVTAVNDHLDFGIVGANWSAASQDTFVIRHDRSKGAFTAQKLGWTITYTEPGVGPLPGDASSQALDSMVNYADPTPYDPAEIESVPGAGRVLRTSLLIYFADDATVGQVNQAVQGSGGYLASMVSGIPYVRLNIPDPGSVTNLQALRQQLQSLPGVGYVALEIFPEPDELPPNASFLTDPPTHLDVISHHLAVRAHAAWNARRLFAKNALAGMTPTIMIEDHFGIGPPTAGMGFDVDYDEADYGTAGPLIRTDGTPSYHGYNVLSIIASTFGGLDDPVGIATGIVPVRLRVIAFDLRRTDLRPSDFPARLVSAVAAERSLGHNVILNTSNGEPGANCPDGDPLHCPNSSSLSNEVEWRTHIGGLKWAAQLRRGGVRTQADSAEFDFLHTTSAGNNGQLPAWVAHDYARFALPTPGHDYGGVALRDISTHQVRKDKNGNFDIAPYLANTLVVESRPGVDDLGADLWPIKPHIHCYDQPEAQLYRSFASYGGHISAIGHMVERRLSGELDQRGVYLPFHPPTNYGSGSSFASPQVAGVAALVWTARPDLTMQQVRQILLKTAGGLTTLYDTTPCPASDTDFYHAPVDAYAAVLAADCPDFNCDLGVSATPASSPVRMAILDVAKADNAGNLVDEPDEQFTQADILKFLQEFQSRRGTSFDYSRFDLDGDGRTGSSSVFRSGQPEIGTPFIYGTRRFDLNGDGQFATAQQVVEGVAMDFDENRLSDLEILVYYAYSPLYEGNEYERTLLLLPYLDWANSSARARPFLRQMSFQLSNLTGIGGDTTLASVFYQGSRTDPVGSGLEGNRFISPCGQEQGAPTFSQEVFAAATGIPSDDSVLVPTWWWSTNPINSAPAGAVYRHCSDFIAAVPSTGKMWINIAKVVSNEPDREYQVRLYLGEPDLLAPKSSDFKPGLRRLLTQKGIYGYVDMKGSGAFVGGSPSSEFQLLSVGFVPDTLHWYYYRD